MNILLNIAVIVTVCARCSYGQNDDEKNDPDFNSKTFCLQKRFKDLDDCKEYNDLCDNIECEPIEECDPLDSAIVEHRTGRGCCPACVQYQDEGEECDVGAQLKQCKNGMTCNPATKKCDIPLERKTNCLIESHNRHTVERNDMMFYIEGNEKDKPNENTYYGIKFAEILDHPDCDYETGQFALKQCRRSRCYCVNPSDGKFTFGTIPFYLAENVTCKCAQHFYERLSSASGQVDEEQMNINNMEHYSSIHSKCDEHGNFEPLQCINGTCFCVNEKTGQPLDQKGVIYGALSTLPCFDKEKSDKLKTKESDANYLNPCEKDLLRTKSMAYHFMRKGSTIIGEDKITCSFDGKFFGRQCTPAQCFCVTPDDAKTTAYHLDRVANRELEMECRCAREEYYKDTEHQSYEQLQCDDLGNFKAWQCFDNNQQCFCVDNDGGRISEKGPTDCLDRFLKQYYPGDSPPSKDSICNTMRLVFKSKEAMDDNTYYRFDKSFVPIKIPKPEGKQMFQCGGKA